MGHQATLIVVYRSSPKRRQKLLGNARRRKTKENATLKIFDKENGGSEAGVEVEEAALTVVRLYETPDHLHRETMIAAIHARHVAATLHRPGITIGAHLHDEIEMFTFLEVAAITMMIEGDAMRQEDARHLHPSLLVPAHLVLDVKSRLHPVHLLECVKQMA